MKPLWIVFAPGMAESLQPMSRALEREGEAHNGPVEVEQQFQWVEGRESRRLWPMKSVINKGGA